VSAYLHCPNCQRAYDAAVRPACPSCGDRVGAPADPTDAVIAAAEQLSHAIARANDEQLAAAAAKLAARGTYVPLLNRPAPPLLAQPADVRGRAPLRLLATAMKSAVDRAARLVDQAPRFLFAKLQLTSFQNSSTYFGRALR
jgi:hypothetical protein